MFARFQKDRIRKARNISSSFSLNEGKADNLLTHKGKVLGESNLDDADDFSDDSEAGAGKTGSLSKDIVSSLHFGGGFVKKDRVNEPEVFQKDRLTALQEIVMKSKLAKIQKKEFKEDQENERLKLDSAFDSLLSSSTLDITDLERTKNGRFRKDRMADTAAASGTTRNSSYEDSYDQSLIELAFDTKAKPSDRTKSATEIALEEREKLEKLEAARLKRMNGGLDYEDDENLGDDDGHGHGDGNNARVSLDRNAGKVSKKASLSSNSRSRVRTDDDLDEDAAESGKKTLATEVKSSSASGDGNGSDDGETNDGDEGSDDDNDASDDEDDYDEEDNDEGGEGSDESEGVEEDEDDYEDDILPGSNTLPVAPKSKSTKGSSAVDLAHGVDSDRVFRVGRSNKVRKTEEEESDLVGSVNPNMPHNIECPSDLESFEHLVEEHVRCPADMRALIDRILIWNSIHLPGKQGADNKSKMHNFMDILLKVFVGEADMLSSCDKTQDLEEQVTVDYAFLNSMNVDVLCNIYPVGFLLRFDISSQPGHLRCLSGSMGQNY